MHGWFVCPTVSMVTTSQATVLEKTIEWVVAPGKEGVVGRCIWSMSGDLRGDVKIPFQD